MENEITLKVYKFQIPFNPIYYGLFLPVWGDDEDD